ncbi:hypothetical protein ADUPG1_011948 [Aduncisulcus paluster]|uniref:Guanylate-binding protein N-terminal domain-containing protein n=1 Tax=Aduncisulcus paluster TaxID=2918883 RepID=A0ABQ5K1I3_9EUKA|nr:hypothetical protein ADUPG1_011948 [Aduncisulcus paluster]
MPKFETKFSVHSPISLIEYDRGKKEAITLNPFPMLGLNPSDELIFVSAIGVFQGGKSFLLSRLCGCNFKIGNSFEPETANIEMSEPISLHSLDPSIPADCNKYIVFIDTIGMDDCSAGVEMIRRCLFPVLVLSNIILINFREASGASISEMIQFALSNSKKQEISPDRYIAIGRNTPIAFEKKVHSILKERLGTAFPENTDFFTLPQPSFCPKPDIPFSTPTAEWEKKLKQLRVHIASIALHTKFTLTMQTASKLIKKTFKLAQKDEFSSVSILPLYKQALVDIHYDSMWKWVKKEISTILEKFTISSQIILEEDQIFDCVDRWCEKESLPLSYLDFNMKSLINNVKLQAQRYRKDLELEEAKRIRREEEEMAARERKRLEDELEKEKKRSETEMRQLRKIHEEELRERDLREEERTMASSSRYMSPSPLGQFSQGGPRSDIFETPGSRHPDYDPENPANPKVGTRVVSGCIVDLFEGARGGHYYYSPTKGTKQYVKKSPFG